MNRERQDGLYLFLMGCAIFVLVCLAAERMGIAWMVDFKSVYYGTRCLIEHKDPYNASDLVQVFQAESGLNASSRVEAGRLQAETIYVNMPTSFAVVSPFALLNWRFAHILWMLFTGLALLISSFLIWRLSVDLSPILAGALLAIWLIDAIPVVLVGNAAGITIGLCIDATWYFTEKSYEIPGVLCLAVGLVLKPHDVWLVWLFYLFAGGIHRKRALQVLAVTTALSCASVVWVLQDSPHWFSELQRNLGLTGYPGSINDPSPVMMAIPTVGSMVHLQTVFAVFWSASSIYNLLTYIVCGALIAIWAVTSIRGRLNPQDQWLALAAGAFLSLLPVYHRTHDAKLILVAVPACAMLYCDKGALGKAPL